MFSMRVRSAVAVVSGGAALCGFMKVYHKGDHTRNATVPKWRRYIDDIQSSLPLGRFSASCAYDGRVSPDDMMLYWASGSPFCWRLMITLEEKGLSGYKEKLLTMSKKENKTEEVLALNPRGQVPTFKHGGVVINESQAACDYIASLYADKGADLCPKDPEIQAKVLQRKYEAEALKTKGLFDLFQLKKKGNQEELNKGIEACREELQLWDDILSKEGQSYLAGKQFTMADVAFYPLLALMVRLGVELEPRYPSLAKYYNLVSSRPSVQASWPPHWRGTPRADFFKDV